MAKPAAKQEALALKVSNKDDADKALWAMGRLRDSIAAAELAHAVDVRELEEGLSREIGPLKKSLASYEKALEKWARQDYSLPPGWGETRSLLFTCGRIFFRLSPPALRLVRSVEFILERLRARKMTSCIRIKEEVNKEALEAYDDEILRDIGCRRTQKDEFYYEVFPGHDSY